MANREQCDNCGKFVAKTIGRRYSDNTGMITCDDCGDTLLWGVDHWCRCSDCGAELPNTDYDGQCKRCYLAEVQDEKRASYYEQNWHNDHGDFE